MWFFLVEYLQKEVEFHYSDALEDIYITSKQKDKTLYFYSKCVDDKITPDWLHNLKGHICCNDSDE